MLSRLQTKQSSVQEIVIKALENYLKSQEKDIRKTRTWDLCGSFQIAEPEPKYIIGEGDRAEPITNYAENVDDILFSCC